MKKYKHKQTGQVVTKGTDGLYHSKEGGYTLQQWIFENSNDWELIEVNSKDVLSFIGDKISIDVSKSYYMSPGMHELKSEILENKPNIEVGKIYKNPENNNHLILVKYINDYDALNCIGFDGRGVWTPGVYSPLGLVEATKEEWFERLNEERIKRGLLDGVKFKGAYGGNLPVINGCFISEIKGEYHLLTNSCDFLMDSETGKWATPIKEEITSVKNSKGVIFKIGDDVCYGSDIFKIECFEVADDNKGGVYACFKTGSNVFKALIELIEYKKKPILTTHDGVELFYGNECWGVAIQASVNDMIVKARIPFDSCRKERRNRVWFSTKEKALEYIEWNEKRYSLNDIKNAGVLDFSINKIKKIKK